MTKLNKEDDKYKETKYRRKKIDTSSIKITIGTEIYHDGKLYGIIIRESEHFYYLYNEEAKAKDEAAGRTYEPFEFMKQSLKEKILKGIFNCKEAKK